MSLVQTIIAAVALAKSQLDDLIIDTTLRRVSSVYDSTTSKTVETEITVSISIAIIKFEFKEIDGALVQEGDLKGVVFDVTQSIDLTDRIAFKGVEYQIMKLVPIYAGDTLVLIEVQLRK